jgi:hypothetical protein
MSGIFSTKWRLLGAAGEFDYSQQHLNIAFLLERTCGYQAQINTRKKQKENIRNVSKTKSV